MKLKRFLLSIVLSSFIFGCVSQPVEVAQPEETPEVQTEETPVISKPSLLKRTIKDVDLKTHADEKGMKKRVVVLPLLDRDGTRSEDLLKTVYNSFLDDLNKGTDIIALSSTELKLDLNSYLKNNEYQLEEIAKKSISSGASALLEAKVVDIRFKNSNQLESKNEIRKASFEIVVKARLVSIRTGQELMNVVKTVQLEEENTKIPSQITSDVFFNKNPELVELLIRDGLIDFVPKLAESMTQITWEGRIAALQGEKVFLNVGKISGVQLGDILKVVDDGNEIYDPELGYHIGKVQGKVKGTLEVISFFGQDSAVSVIHSGAGFKEMTELNYTNKIENQYLGLVDYSKAEKLQHDLVRLVAQTKYPIVIGLEHPLVLTTGYRLNPTDYQHLGLPVQASSRGGLLTIHNEGQLVIYPIIALHEWGGGVKDYVKLLLQTTQLTLNDLGISTELDLKSVGLYTSTGKIAFCGIQIKNGITLHGISLNVFNDTKVFQEIEACGVTQLKTDKVYNYNHDCSLKDIFQIWMKHFKLNRPQ